MFPAIYELAKTTTLTMLISANQKEGTLTVCVKPTPRKGEEGALAHELSLTATPDEFEKSFPECLTTYTTQHKSLVEQTAATTAVLEAAKQAQVELGKKAVSAATKTIPPKATIGKPPAVPLTPPPEDDTEGGDSAKVQDDDLFGD